MKRKTLQCKTFKKQQKLHSLVCSIKSLHQETEKSQIKNRTLHIREFEKEGLRKPKDCRRKVIIKIRAEIKEIETNKIQQRINEIKSRFFKKDKHS